MYGVLRTEDCQCKFAQQVSAGVFLGGCIKMAQGGAAPEECSRWERRVKRSRCFVKDGATNSTPMLTVSPRDSGSGLPSTHSFRRKGSISILAMGSDPSRRAAITEHLATGYEFDFSFAHSPYTPWTWKMTGTGRTCFMILKAGLQPLKQTSPTGISGVLTASPGYCCKYGVLRTRYSYEYEYKRGAGYSSKNQQ